MTTKRYSFKLVMLGASGVGKSSLALRFVKDFFDEDHQSTMGACFLIKEVHVDNVIVKLEIWDTAGQERYQSLAPLYYRSAEAAIIVYDATNYSSFSKAKIWVKELKERSDVCVIILVSNKMDLPDKKRVNTEDAMDYADNERILFMEASAKTGHNVQEIFNTIAQKLPKVDNLVQNDIFIDLKEDPPKKYCCIW